MYPATDTATHNRTRTPAIIPSIFHTLLPDFAGATVGTPCGSPAPPYGGAGWIGGAPGGMPGAPPMNVGVSDGVGITGGSGCGAGAATIVASGGACGAGGCMPRSVIFGRTIVSLPVGCGGLLAGAGGEAGGILGSRRAPQFPQKRSSALT